MVLHATGDGQNRSALRNRGRPSTGNALTEAAILEAALTLLESRTVTFSLRALARHLKADPMALYHYFPNKQALLAAAVHSAFSPLDLTEADFQPEDDLVKRLETLAGHYVAAIERYPGLTIDIIAGHVPAQAVTAHFDRLFAQATAPLNLPRTAVSEAGHVLVDYLHGVMLAGQVPGQVWRTGVRLIAAGLHHQQSSERRS